MWSNTARAIRSNGCVHVARQRMHEARRRLERSLEKNLPDTKALLTGRMPAFVTRRRAGPSREVPVFVFHEVEPDHLEAQLRYLRENGYVTLGAGELEAAARGERPRDRAVVLTFDDATSAFWSHAFPLLRRYEARAILFAIPGLVPDDPTTYPNLSDVWAGSASLAGLEWRRSTQPLCTWQELGIMHASGLVDIESHSLWHARVPVSARIVDFVHPGLDTYFFGDIDLPLSALDSHDSTTRDLRLGAPIFESAPRLAGRPRFFAVPELVNALVNYVDSHDGERFFERSSWRRELVAIAKQWRRSERGRFETTAQGEAAMADGLAQSKRELERRLEGKRVRHLCYPWFAGCPSADRLAAQTGYQCLHYGIDVRAEPRRTDDVLRIRRISERYLACLPGHGRSSLARTLALELRERARRARGSQTTRTTSSPQALPSVGHIVASGRIGDLHTRNSRR